MMYQDQQQQTREIDDDNSPAVREFVRQDDLPMNNVGSTQGGDKVEYVFLMKQLHTISDTLNMVRENYEARGNKDSLLKILDEYLVEVGDKIEEVLGSQVSALRSNEKTL
eukprot:322912-Ditylum_brightwellii.AAC.1